MTPSGNWINWLCLAGRGWGKTRVGAEDFARFGMKNPGSRLAIIAATYQSARDVCVEGESGLLNSIPEKLVRDWNRSIGELTLANGTQYRIFTGEKPSALRGPQHHRIWADEIPHWKYPDDVWDMAQMGLRLGAHPQNVITSTPLPIKLIRDLKSSPHTVLSVGSTYDNRDNLPESFLHTILAKYEGTRLGDQELYAKVLDDMPGALWQRANIDATRIRGGVTPDEIARKCRRVIVAIDPAVTNPKKLSADKDEGDIDETGIVVVGIDADGRGYTLADESCRLSPQGWGTRAVNLYKRFHADRIVGEVNNGGDLVEEVIRMVDPNVSFKRVWASKGKYKRAEPIAALYEQHRVSHVGTFERLEDQMCLFTPEQVEKNSPDRADALVWGMTEIFDGCMNLGLLQFQRETLAQTAKAVSASNAATPVTVCQCGSSAVAKVGTGYRCNQCGAQFGAVTVGTQLISRTDALRGQHANDNWQARVR